MASRYVLCCLALVISSSLGSAQTADTGALVGNVMDPSGASVPNAKIVVINEAKNERRVALSGADGGYRIPLLRPGSYRVEASGQGFRTALYPDIRIAVTETSRLDISLELGQVAQRITVSAINEIVQTETSNLGRVIDEQAIQQLPLVSRNYTQIVALSPGIVMDVTNAGQLGRGTGGESNNTDSIFANGMRGTDNSFVMDGIDISDTAAYSFLTGGVAIPNPDTLQEFKVQTGLYDAAYGRTAGANIAIVTKSGTNNFHGSVFEYFRNEALNANDFFFNRAGQEKPVLRQNQFGFTLGGPILKDRLFFFGSYQGTRQVNGLSYQSKNSVFGPPLTDDRSAAALGALFGGMTGALGGVAVAPDGSNINPVAFQLLNLKLPDGSYLMKTPQLIEQSQPFESEGFSTFSVPSPFNEDQYMANIEYAFSPTSKLSGRFFSASSNQQGAFSDPGQSNVPGFAQGINDEFRNFTLAHIYSIGPNLLNEAKVGFYRTNVVTGSDGKPPFTYSQLGIASIPQSDGFPNILIEGSYAIGGLFEIDYTQNHYSLSDTVSYVRGRHNLQFGAGFMRSTVDFNYLPSSGIDFLSFPDFLLGLDGVANGSGFSNVSFTFDSPGQYARSWVAVYGHAYAQDNYRVNSRLTLNLGLRYERLGDFGEVNGRNSGFDPGLADRNPPATGTLSGFTVPSNFQYSLPAGVFQYDNILGLRGLGQNQIEPRVGFAWQILPGSSRFVLRGGYGWYASTLPGATQFTSGGLGAPFGIFRGVGGIDNVQATFADPFPHPLYAPTDFPLYEPYSPTSTLSLKFISPAYQPAIVQQFGLNVQTGIAPNLLLEVGYVGTRATHLIRGRSINQALLATTSTPVRGETTSTLANISERVPFQGFSSQGLYVSETSGASWYNSLQASLTKRFSRGLQFLASYTFSKLLDTDPGNFFTSNGGRTVGDQNDPSRRYGRASTDRTHRVVISYNYEFPKPSGLGSVLSNLLGGWSVGGVTTFQSGRALTLSGTNSKNVYGISGDVANLASGCTPSGLVTSGAVTDKLNNYFNQGCIALYPVIGDDGVATAFGNAGQGIVTGPDQRNFDIAISKKTALSWPNEKTNLEFRTEFFNAFNTAQFGDPVTNSTSSAFGIIGNTSVNPRVIQLALKLHF